MSRSRLTTLLLVPLLAGACDQSGPTGLDQAAIGPTAALLAGSGADTERREFNRFVSFTTSVTCLGGSVLVRGPISGWEQVVVKPDGSLHVTQFLDVADVTISLGDELWTAQPNASEIFVLNFSAQGSLRQSEHVGVVTFRAGDGRPALHFVHQIHLVRAPDGSVQVNHQILDISCIGPER